jgi:rRNA small subunit aminocarboxypropyltransferase
MASSRSTPGPSADGRVRLFVWIVGEDNPRLCTGRRLARFALAEALYRPEFPGHPVLLDPRAPTPVSRTDRLAARRDGILAVDCSWNQLASRGELPEGGLLSRRTRPRRLPWLVATNPQHYGRWNELNTAEALAAALHVLGEPGQASALLAPFAGAAEFWKVNSSRLRLYGEAVDSEGVQTVERSAG